MSVTKRFVTGPFAKTLCYTFYLKDFFTLPFTETLSIIKTNLPETLPVTGTICHCCVCNLNGGSFCLPVELHVAQSVTETICCYVCYWIFFTFSVTGTTCDLVGNWNDMFICLLLEQLVT